MDVADEGTMPAAPSRAADVDDAELLALFEQLPEMIVLIDAAGRIRHVNERLLKTMGYTLDGIVGTNVFDYVHPDDLAYMAWAWENRESHPGELGLIVQARGRNADGSWRACEILGLSLLEDDAVAGMVMTLRDLSHQAALADSPARLRSMVDRTTDVVLLLDTEGRFLYSNRRLTSRYGHDQDRVVGQPWTSILDPDDAGAATRWFADLIDAGDRASSRVRLRIREPGGAVNELEWHGTNQLDDPLIGGIIVNGRDITELVAMERQLRDQNAQLLHAATHDPLTGLLNRPAFVERVAEAIDTRRGIRDRGDAVVLFCDLDGFKAVNDQYGHEAGDQVLASVASRLRDSVRHGDVVARYGGDEFTVLLGDSASPAVVTGLVARLQAKIAEPITLIDVTAEIGVAIGISRCPVARASVDELLREADAAMYTEKRRRSG